MRFQLLLLLPSGLRRPINIMPMVINTNTKVFIAIRRYFALEIEAQACTDEACAAVTFVSNAQIQRAKF
jgi:hypothetical protein